MLGHCRFNSNSSHGNRTRRRLRAEQLEPRRLLTAQPTITEFMAANNGSLLDGDGNPSDWVEIYNAGDEALDLAGWRLTDDPGNLDRWTFPSVELSAGQYLIVFASGQNQHDYVDAGGFLHTDFALDADGEYLALVQPDGATVASEFGTAAQDYPRQYGDVSFGTAVEANTTTLIASGPAPTAGPVIVPNHSFESPATATAVSEATGWTGAGPTGVFANSAGFGNELVNVDGDQIAYMNTDVGTQLSVALEESYVAGLSYTLTVAVAGRSDTPGNPGDQLGIRLYYGDNVANTIDEAVVTYSQLSTTELSDFALTLPAVSGTDPWAGQPIGVQLVSLSESNPANGGDWTLDNVRLHSSGSIIPPANTASFLIPTDDALATTWTGGDEPFDGTGWTPDAMLGVGFDQETVVPGSTALGYWPLDGDAADGSTHGHDGAVVGGTFSTDAPDPPDSSHSLTLNGAGQFVDLGDAADFDFDWNEPFSLSAWIKSSTSQDSTIVGKMLQGGTYRGYEMHVGSTAGAGRVNFWIIHQWPGQVIEINGTVNVLDGQWHHVAVTYDGSGDAAGAKIFVDGQLDAAASVGKNTLGGSTILNDGPLNIGTRQNGTAHDFAGQVDDVSIWPEALSAGHVAGLFAGQSPTAGTTTTDIDYTELIHTDVGAQMHGVNASAYLRIPFQVDDFAAFDRLILRTQYDDGFVAYINGDQVAQQNAPAVPAFDSTATAEHPSSQALQHEDVAIDLATLQAGSGALRVGENILAVHLLNIAHDDEDALFAAELVAQQTLAVHTQYFSPPTPGAANAFGVVGFVADTRFSVDRGVFFTPFELDISTDTPGADIYYTTDGSVPSPTNASATLYSTPIAIASTSVVRAAAFRTGYQSTNVDTQTYVFPDDVIGQGNVQPGHAHWDTEMDPSVTGPLQVDLLAGLTEIPTVSLSLPEADIFGAGGIYSNPGNRGEAWERAASVEYFDPNNGDAFQLDAGLRVQGGASRSTADPKHGFRLLFNEQYGATKLEYPLFEDSEVDRFDQLVLRAGLGDVWTIHWGANLRQHATYFNDQWARESRLAMGGTASRGEFVHLYVNGLYWGLYNLVERPDNSFSAQHRGGDKDDWDIIHDNQVQNGDRVEWDAMMSLANAGLTDPVSYQAIQEYLDLEQFADYMILNIYAGNWDWPEHNWWAGRNDADPDSKFEFYAWDSEQILENQFIPDFKGGVGTVNMDSNSVQYIANFNTPGFLYHRLRLNGDFQRLFADRVQTHMFGDGALTASAAANRFAALRDEIMNPIVAESARWGDAHVEPALTRDDNWLPDVNRTIDEYLPQRTEIVLQQFRALGLYPGIGAPQFRVNGVEQHGGVVSSGDLITMVSPTVTVYQDTTLIAEQGHAATALVPIDDSLETGSVGTRWFDHAFVPGPGWLSGTGGVGYEDDGDLGGDPGPFAPLIGLDVQDAWDAPGAESSVYSRFNFDVNADPADYERLTLRMKYDDGFVAYLNGTPVASSFAPAAPTWNSTTEDGYRTEPDSLTFQDFDLTPYLGLLAQGDNLLAIHGLNSDSNSTDLLILPVLVIGDEVQNPSAPIYFTTDGTDPRAPDGQPSGQLYEQAVPVTESTRVAARAVIGGQWSALSEAAFVINPAASSNLVISEINFNPAAPTPGELAQDAALDNDDFEFVEWTNISSEAVSLADVAFAPGDPIDFAFADGSVFTLGAGETVLVVRNLEAFRIRYGAGLDDRIAGVFADGGLNNGGEQITLLGRDGSVIRSFAYDDRAPWPSTADGLGYSLVLKDPASNTDHANPFNWRASAALGGSPGVVDPAGPAAIVVNEALSSSDGALLDAIELYNPTGGDVNVGGWFLTDDENLPQKYQIADPTVIPAGGYLTFDETHFNPSGGVDPNDFALSATGDEVFLFSANPTTDALTGYVHGFAFGAAANNVAFIRRVDSTGYEHFVAQAEPGTSLGAANEPFRVGEVVITELHYNPKTSDPGETFVDEFIEIQNVSDGEVPLFDPDNSANTWVVNGAAFAFPAASLVPGEVALIVSIDPEAFRASYSLPAELQIFGPFLGSLSDGGETISLQRPTAPAPETPLIVPLIDVDVVRFDDDPPWTTLPDGGNGDGSSLNRLAPDNFGSDPLSWTAAEPTPGDAFAIRHVVGRHLFYGGSVFDAPDHTDAIAIDKSPLLPGERARFANYSSYEHGINGLIVDLLNPTATPTSGDFTFRVGNVDDTASWQPAPPTASFAVDEGGGTFGSTRVTITWTDGDITGQWLEIAIAASPTGTTDVFYYGNAIGETGDNTSNALVTAADLIAIRNHGRGPANRATVINPHDISRDAEVDAIDTLLARNNATGPFDALRLISAPLPVPPPADAEGENAAFALIHRSRSESAIDQRAQVPDRQSTDTLPERTFANLDDALADLLLVGWR